MPNQKVLGEKQAAVAALKERLGSAQSGVLVDYKGINVANDTALRRRMREAGVEYTVVKNTLFNFAIQDTDLADLAKHLSGTTALATSATDLIAPARILKEYADKSNGAFAIKGGFVEGQPVDEAGVKQLADMPSREQLIARMLGGLNAPISGLVNVLNGNLRGLVVALNAIAEKQSAA